jgi:hypothetical protein
MTSVLLCSDSSRASGAVPMDSTNVSFSTARTVALTSSAAVRFFRCLTASCISCQTRRTSAAPTVEVAGRAATFSSACPPGAAPAGGGPQAAGGVAAAGG